MEASGTFKLRGTSAIQIDRKLDERNELSIWFRGDILARQHLELCLAHVEGLVKLATAASVRHVHCHLEELGEALSRAQCAIYRMLYSIRVQGIPVTIYTTGELPEQSEHHKMSKLFVEELSKRPGPPMELVQISQLAS